MFAVKVQQYIHKCKDLRKLGYTEVKNVGRNKKDNFE